MGTKAMNSHLPILWRCSILFDANSNWMMCRTLTKSSPRLSKFVATKYLASPLMNRFKLSAAISFARWLKMICEEGGRERERKRERKREREKERERKRERERREKREESYPWYTIDWISALFNIIFVNSAVCIELVKMIVCAFSPFDKWPI